jgi:hypothetical protein
MPALALAVFAVALASPPTAAAPDQQPCPPPAAIVTKGPGFSGPQKLTQVPDANLMLAVLRRVDGCDYQQVVRFHVSSPGAQTTLDLSGARTIKGLDGVLVPSGVAIEPLKPTGERR